MTPQDQLITELRAEIGRLDRWALEEREARRRAEKALAESRRDLERALGLAAAWKAHGRREAIRQVVAWLYFAAGAYRGLHPVTPVIFAAVADCLRDRLEVEK